MELAEYERTKLKLAAQAWHERQNSTVEETSQPRPSRQTDGSLERFMGRRQTASKASSRPTSTAREGQRGQQYRVGNLGNNGFLYLRPVNRPPRSSPPRVPSQEYSDGIGGAYTTAPADDHSLASEDTDAFRSSGRGSALIAEGGPVPSTPPLGPSHAHSRTLSKSQDLRSSGSGPPTPYQLIIDQASPRRINSARDQASDDMLEVPIPHYRLGRPEFSGRGSAALRSSINTYGSATDGRSSMMSLTNQKASQGLWRSNSREESNRGSAAESRLLSVSPVQRRTISSELLPLDVSYNLDGKKMSFRNSTKASRDDKSVVRLSSTTGHVLAATPSGLIAQITSPNMLDYELLSDFFLTFRSYLSSSEVMGFLFTRLCWAVSSKDDFGRIVRVRTFVALRHWILNYFVDDFVRDYALRSLFCDSVNQLYHALKARYDGGGGDLNIVGELKKCWRRTCALYWDVPEHKSNEPGSDIIPGGQIGSRDMLTDESNTGIDKYGRPSQDLPAFNQSYPLIGPASFPFPTAHKLEMEETLGMSAAANARPVNSERMSHLSTEAQSCSIPKSVVQKTRPKAPPSSYAPRPVGSRKEESNSGSETPLQQHRRSGSFSDSRRDDRAPISTPKPIVQDAAVASSYPFPGSLVRGAIYQPTSPYVHNVLPSSPTREKSNFDFQSAEDRTGVSSDESAGATNPAVKKLIGTVRRALSARQPSTSTSARDRADRYKRNASATVSANATARSSFLTLNQAAGTPKRILVGGRAQLRLDILGAAAVEGYKRVVTESIEADGRMDAHDLPTRLPSQRMSQSVPPQSDRLQVNNPRANSHVTDGSRSIVIVDDTGDHPPLPVSGINRAGSGTSRAYASSQGADSNTQNVPIALDLTPRDLEMQSSELGGEYDDEVFEDDQGSSDISASQFPQHTDGHISGSARAVSTNGSVGIQPQAVYNHGDTFHTEESAPSANDLFYLDRLPPHPLRRRPGGDLRAADHVHDLEETYSHANSVASSLPQRSFSTSAVGKSQGLPVTSQYDHQASLQPNSIKVERKSVSMLATHSSQPNFRPSFEKEVARLAEIPDDADDGGIESALSKLEGRHETSPTETRFDLKEADEYQLVEDDSDEEAAAPIDHILSPAEVEELRSETMSTGIVSTYAANSTTEAETMVSSTAPTSTIALSPSRTPKQSRQPNAMSMAESDASYSSVPLLERGVSHPAPRKDRSYLAGTSVPIPRTPNKEAVGRFSDERGYHTRESGMQEVEAKTYQNRPSTSDMRPSTSGRAQDSFLLDDNQTLSSLSETPTEEDDFENEPNAGRVLTSFYHDDTASLTDQLEQVYGGEQTPRQVQEFASRDFHEEQQGTEDLRDSKRFPFRRGDVPNFSKPQLPHTSTHLPPGKSKSALELRDLQFQPSLANTTAASHLPFILGFSALSIAQQLTLIEKDALSEIDWRELIDLRWRQTASSIRNWAEFLTANQRTGLPICSGVDVCIARFNVVVKWAVSEIVLTQDLAERVACVVKYIHIAEHCRQMRNWATMYQITTALVCADSARLKTTWSLVPEREREALQVLEELILPTRNFHNLRAEMETANANRGSSGSNGACIPFIGIYTHDLIYNAQKPAYAGEQSGSDEPMVNFERHHTAASIVKNLLRMLEASAKYSFPPEPELLSRCLWMATLPDEEISRRSQDLDP